MKEAISAMHQILLAYSILSGGLLAIAGSGAWHNRNNPKKMDSSLLYFCVDFLVVSAIVLFCIVPIIRDYVQPEHNIIQTEGIYINTEAGHSGSPSSMIGMYSVTLMVNGEEINLTTAPFHDEVFLEGSYHVTAYYAPISKTLLHIDILDEIESPVSTETD